MAQPENAGTLDVYLAAVPADFIPVPLYPPERAEEIMSPRNMALRRERCAVWMLLGLALRRSFGLAMEQLRFEKLPEGKWVCDRAYFSLSHDRSAVAVAVSDAPVGVDLERDTAFRERFPDPDVLSRLERRSCTPAELAALRGTEDFLALWTKKESIFKCVGGPYFDPAETDARSRPTVTRSVFLPEPCTFSVCGAGIAHLRVFTERLGRTE